jgi:hypothetical protein
MLGNAEYTQGAESFRFNFNATDQSFFQITDNLTTVTQYITSSTYIGPLSLFTTGSVNSLLFDRNFYTYFTTASTFTPKNPAAQYYTPVIDYFGIQKYDLIRLGSFTSPVVKYYEVKNVNTSSRSSINLTGTFRNTSIPPNITSYTFEYNPGSISTQFSVGDIVSITGTNGGTNNITTQVTNINTNLTTYATTMSFNSSVTTQVSTPATFSFQNNNVLYNIEFTSNIDTGSTLNNGLNFAILRPKPNETSVIVDYRKQPGDVSQTVLIPYDANDEIKNSVGNIYKTINPDIS